jgi:hypothetical protein
MLGSADSLVLLVRRQRRPVLLFWRHGTLLTQWLGLRVWSHRPRIGILGNEVLTGILWGLGIYASPLWSRSTLLLLRVLWLRGLFLVVGGLSLSLLLLALLFQSLLTFLLRHQFLPASTDKARTDERTGTLLDDAWLRLVRWRGLTISDQVIWAGRFFVIIHYGGA